VAKNTNTLWRYNLLLRLLSLPILGYTVWQMWRAGNKRYLLQRFGFSYPRVEQKPIWWHAASVGEVNALLPLVELLQKRYPDVPQVVSTVTPTGAEVVRKRYPKNITHVYLPIDWISCINRFLKAIDPQCALVMETELWPNLYRQSYHNNIPLILINGRVSSRTLTARDWLKNIYAITLSYVTAILARSDQDRDGFISLGAKPESIKVIGNIKFAANTSSKIPATTSNIPRPYVLAASTHDNEEVRIIQLWQSLQPKTHLLVIAPRHPKRMQAILQEISGLTDKIALRSKDDPVENETEVYFVDTLGELTAFMQGADVVFMGGSLVNVGGHNILEPAALSKAIVFGPHMENFTDEAELFLANDAALQVSTDQELAECLKKLLASPDRRTALGIHAKELLFKHQGVAQHYLDQLASLCRFSGKTA
jgi:3-deoxy-D-manno-octulosonic-acid transferase